MIRAAYVPTVWPILITGLYAVYLARWPIDGMGGDAHFHQFS